MNDDSLSHVLSYLPLSDLLELRGVSKSWYAHVQFQISKRTNLSFHHLIYKHLHQKTADITKSLASPTRCSLTSEKVYKTFKMNGVLEVKTPKANFFHADKSEYLLSDDVAFYSDCVVSVRWYTGFTDLEMSLKDAVSAEAYVTIPLLRQDYKSAEYSPRLFNTWWSKGMSLSGGTVSLKNTDKKNQKNQKISDKDKDDISRYGQKNQKQLDNTSLKRKTVSVKQKLCPSTSEKRVVAEPPPVAVAVGTLLSLHQTGNSIIGVWNDSALTAFIVHSVFLDINFINTLLPFSTSRKTPKPRPFDYFGISAVVTLRNFKKVYVREHFAQLYLSNETFTSSYTLDGIDKASLSSVKLDKNYGILWRTEHFKGRIPGCVILDVVLKQDGSFSKSVFDLTQFRLSRLCKSRASDVVDRMYQCVVGEQVVFAARSGSLGVEMVFREDEEQDCFCLQDLQIDLVL